MHVRGCVFRADFAACLALRDQRARENAQARERCRSNAELCAVLLTDTQRRGQSVIDWPDYFRNVDVNYP